MSCMFALFFFLLCFLNYIFPCLIKHFFRFLTIVIR